MIQQYYIGDKKKNLFFCDPYARMMMLPSHMYTFYKEDAQKIVNAVKKYSLYKDISIFPVTKENKKTQIYKEFRGSIDVFIKELIEQGGKK